MMGQRLWFIALLLGLFVYAGCKRNAGKDNTEELSTPVKALVMQGREFLKQSPSCATDTVRCATVSARYPLATDGPGEAVRRINDTIDAYVRLSLGVFAASPDDLPESLEETADDFLQEYEAVTTEEAGFATPWSAELEGQVLYQSDEAVSVELTTYSYAGGAHPNYFSFLFTFDPSTGRQLTLAEIVPDTNQVKLIAEEAFRQARELTPGESLSEAGFFWGEPFQLPENWALTADGLYFFYNPYEVAAYAMGITEFTIPRAKLPGMLAPKPEQ